MTTTREEYQARRKAWVEALRSGKYQQTDGVLRNDDGYCCLGVACNLFDAEHWFRDGGHVSFSYINNDTLPPDIVVDWLGLRDNEGCCGGTSLTVQNDAGKTFSEIADLIEERASDLFIPEAL